MGNLSFISFNRAVSDEKFTEMITSVIDKNYGDCYKVIIEEYEDGCQWVVTPKDGILKEGDGSLWCYSLYISRATNYSGKADENGNYPEYKGKFGHKHMRAGMWGYWFTDQILGHLSTEYGATSSDEGVGGTWKNNPKTTPTVAHYMSKHYPSYNKNPAGFSYVMDELPEGLRGIRD